MLVELKQFITSENPQNREVYVPALKNREKCLWVDETTMSKKTNKINLQKCTLNHNDILLYTQMANI